MAKLPHNPRIIPGDLEDRSACGNQEKIIMSVTYYFISDLHIGGDEALGVCDYEAELIEFLSQLAAQQKDVSS